MRMLNLEGTYLAAELKGLGHAVLTLGQEPGPQAVPEDPCAS